MVKVLRCNSERIRYNWFLTSLGTLRSLIDLTRFNRMNNTFPNLTDKILYNIKNNEIFSNNEVFSRIYFY